MTLIAGFQGDKDVAGKDLASAILQQAGFTKVSVTFDFRVLKLRAWALDVDRPIRVLCYGFTNTKTPQGGAIAVLEDWPGKVNFAAVGYEYPSALQNIVLSNDSTDVICSVDVGGSAPWIIYFDILWRGSKYTSVADSVRFRLTRPQPPSALPSPSSSSFSIIGSLETAV